MILLFPFIFNPLDHSRIPFTFNSLQSHLLQLLITLTCFTLQTIC